jgi:hypothetical protein
MKLPPEMYSIDALKDALGWPEPKGQLITFMWRGIDYTFKRRYLDRWFWKITIGYKDYRLIINSFGITIQYKRRDGCITGKALLHFPLHYYVLKEAIRDLWQHRVAGLAQIH